MASCTTKRRELSRGSESSRRPRRYRYFAEFKASSSGRITGSIAFSLVGTGRNFSDNPTNQELLCESFPKPASPQVM